MKTITLKLSAESAEIIRRAVRGYEINMQDKLKLWRDHESLAEQYQQEFSRAANVAQVIEEALKKTG